MATKAVARRSGKWWAIEVPEFPGVFSQAKRLEQVSAMAADALATFLERDVSADEIEVEAHAGDDVDAAIEMARASREEADAARRHATLAMKIAVKVAMDAGLPLRDCGRLIGVTHQRAAAIAREIEGQEWLVGFSDADPLDDPVEKLRRSIFENERRHEREDTHTA